MSYFDVWTLVAKISQQSRWAWIREICGCHVLLSTCLCVCLWAVDKSWCPLCLKRYTAMHALDNNCSLMFGRVSLWAAFSAWRWGAGAHSGTLSGTVWCFCVQPIILIIIMIIVIIETPGNWHHELIRELERRATIITGDSRETTYLFQQLSVAFQRGTNAASCQNTFTAG